MSYAIGHDSDALVTSLFLAALAHAVFILGVSFVLPPQPETSDNLPTLDVTIVPRQSAPAPDNPDFLAAANRDGASSKVKPIPLPENTSSPPPKTRQPKPAVLTRKKSPQRTISASRIMENAMELLALNEKLNRSREAYDNRTRKTFIDARTREHIYASYLANWVAKVEKVGNLNYPDEARRRRLSGTLRLQVALNPDGTVHEISLLSSSGYRVLDDAAVRIVNMSSPFAPFPAEIRKRTDILYIIRTWEFLSNKGLYSR